METLDHLIVGAGYVGRRLALRLSPGSRVHSLVSRAASATALQSEGLVVTACDLDTAVTMLTPGSRRLYYLVPPPAQGRDDPRLARFLALTAAPHRFVYLSTTAVYGDTHGDTVDESSPTVPTTERGTRRLAAEQRVRAYAEAHGIEWSILRVPGIYGPDRLPLDRLSRGEPVLAPADAGITNRIHVEDLVSALILVAQHPDAAGQIYNVSDGAPCSTSEHFMRVARIAGLPPPPVVPRAQAVGRISPAFLSYLDESRRLDSTRIGRELGFVARYADPDAGIRASLPDQTGLAARS
jgi:nucleoside-diphosphate-sugar epimerase